MEHSSQPTSKNPSVHIIIMLVIVSSFILHACSSKVIPSPEISSKTPIISTVVDDQETATPSESAVPTITLEPSPTPIPDNWKSYVNPTLGIQLRYPPEWSLESPSRLSGADGYVDIATQDYPTSLFEQIDNLCVLEANFNDQQPFGPLPLVSKWYGYDSEQKILAGNGCIVMSSLLSSTFPPKAVLYARSPSESLRGRLLVLRGETQFFLGILSTLRFLDYATPTPSTGFYNSPACQTAVDHRPQIVLSTNELTVTEIAIANESCDPLNSFDGFQTNLSSIDMDQFGLTWQTGLTQQAEINNQSLEPFGYRLVKVEGTSFSYDLYKGEELLIPGLTRLGQVSVNSDGDDFVMWVQNVHDGKPPIEVRSNAVREISPFRESTTWNDGFNTAWVGKDLMAYEYSSSMISPLGAQNNVNITRNGEVVKIFSASQPEVSGNPVVNFWSWEGHWLLEMDNVVIQDGKALNQITESTEVFEWQLLNGQPFFLFLKNGKFGINYDGQDLPISYDSIIHNHLCCDPARYNIVSIPSGVRFFALKNNTWMLVYVQAR